MGKALGAATALLVVAAGFAVAPAASASTTGTCTESTNTVWCTVGSGTWTPPFAVHEVKVDVEGAHGGGSSASSTAPGGPGGEATATVAVGPNETFGVIVGGRGGAGSFGSSGAGGTNGGGNGGPAASSSGGGGGGGRSEIDFGTGCVTAGCRLVVAGGGGGAGNPVNAGGGSAGGEGGGTDGTAGADGFGGAHGAGGGPGTSDAVGVHGAGSTACNPGSDGADGAGSDGGAGGSAATTSGVNGSGGGGGGGFFGGGGGGGAATGGNGCDSGSNGGGGGGGGSGYLDPSPGTVSNGVLTAGGGPSGDGIVVFTFDTTPPDTTITSLRRHGRTAKFRFSSSEAGSTFECSLDGQSFSACTSPEVYRHLARGRHTFSVDAVDSFGNSDPTPATRAFRIR
jgi:hypothetical protein